MTKKLHEFLAGENDQSVIKESAIDNKKAKKILESAQKLMRKAEDMIFTDEMEDLVGDQLMENLRRGWSEMDDYFGDLKAEVK